MSRYCKEHGWGDIFVFSEVAVRKFPLMCRTDGFDYDKLLTSAQMRTLVDFLSRQKGRYDRLAVSATVTDSAAYETEGEYVIAVAKVDIARRPGSVGFCVYKPVRLSMSTTCNLFVEHPVKFVIGNSEELEVLP